MRACLTDLAFLVHNGSSLIALHDWIIMHSMGVTCEHMNFASHCYGYETAHERLVQFATLATNARVYNVS